MLTSRQITVAVKLASKKLLFDEYVTSGQAGLKESDLAANRDGQLLAKCPYFERIIHRYIPADRRIRILDLGCGHGRHISLLKRYGYGNIAGVDVSREQVDMAHRLGILEVQLGDVRQFVNNENESAQVVLMMDVLEHLEIFEAQQLLRDVFKTLTINGKLIIHVPNGEGLFGQRVRYGDLTHETCFTPKSIRQLLFPIGFQNIQCVEDRPVAHGLTSVIRRIIWDTGTLWSRLLLMAETGGRRFVLSQNMLVIAEKM